jgi:L-rhamnose-H+ transport protein
MIVESSTKGIVAVAMAGLSSGSFPAPSKGVTAWKWEHIWLVYSFFSMGLLPVGFAVMFGHGIITMLVANEPRLALTVGAFGLLRGIGSILFGVSLVRLGMAITNALVSGVLVFVGSLGPVLIGAVRIDEKRLLWLILALAVLLLSLVLCATASVSRDRVQGVRLAPNTSVAQSVSVVLIASLAGALLSLLNIGFVVGAPLARRAIASGCPALLASLAIWVPALFGGLLLNVGYPAYLISRSRSWPTLYGLHGSAALWLRSSSMGVLWFTAILLYGFGASLIGNEGAVYGWALLMAISILTSNAWGAVTGEWRGSGIRARILMLLSTVLLISSFVVLAAQRFKS